MTKQLRIGVLHYHFFTSGVQTVIANCLRGLIAQGHYDSLEIDLISSDARQSNGKKMASELLDWARQKGPSQFRLSQIEINELAYNHQPAQSKETLFQQSQHIAQRILQSMELSRNDKDNPYVLHVHNANLGKNPFLTLAMKLLVNQIERENLPVIVLFQVHDFAEENRPDDWKALLQCSGQDDAELAVEMMYPTKKFVHWVCINSADRNILLAMGMHPDTVSILPNCVDSEIFSNPPICDMAKWQLEKLQLTRQDFAQDLKNRIDQFARKEGFYFDPSRKILLSPIKAIRRKNVAESILLLMMLNHRDDNYQLLVTLPGNSPPDIEYGQLLEKFVKKYQLPVVMHLGKELLKAGHQRVITDGRVADYSLVDMMAISHAVVTTSIQEGFGYVFHEPWVAGKMVLGRNIAEVTSDFVAQGMNLNHLYDHLLIPHEWLGEKWETICQSYLQKIKTIRLELNSPGNDEKKLKNQIEQRKILICTKQNLKSSKDETKMTDWADLDVDTQLSILEQLARNIFDFDEILTTKNPSDPENIRQLSRTLWFPDDFSGIIEQNRKTVVTKYDMETITCRFIGLIERVKSNLFTTEKKGEAEDISNEAIFTRSLNLENMRLLA